MADNLLAQKLQALNRWRHASAVYSPLITRLPLAVAIGTDQTVHAVSCAPADSDDLPQRLALATVQDPSQPPKWTPLPRGVFAAAHPVFIQGAEPQGVAVVGLPDPMPDRAKVNSRIVLAFPDGNDLVPLLEPVSMAIRVALGPQKQLYCLGRKWIAPTVEPPSWPLMLSGTAPGGNPGFKEVLAPTNAAGSFPTDAALHVASGGTVHVVYDGLSQTAPGGPRSFWHLQLSADGKLQSAASAGKAGDNIVFTRIVANPAGALFLWTVFCPSREDKRLEARVMPLQGTDEQAGAEVHSAADPWMQLHQLHWKGDRFETSGAKAIPV